MKFKVLKPILEIKTKYRGELWRHQKSGAQAPELCCPSKLTSVFVLIVIVLHLNDERGLNLFIAELASYLRTVAITISQFWGVVGQLSQVMILLGLSFKHLLPSLGNFCFQHRLEGLVDEVIDTMKADFVYKRDNLGKLVTRVNRLADPDHGSAIQSFRKNEEMTSKFPNVFWSWTEIPPLWPFVNCINELCNGQSFEIYVGSILFLKSFISV